MTSRTEGGSAESNVLLVEGSLNAAKERTELRLADGRVVRVATALLLEGSSGVEPEYRVGTGAAKDGFEGASELTIPVIEERLVVGRRVVETGKVLLEKHVHEYQEALDIPLAARTFDVERVVLNEPVEVAPGVRVEGETTIYPIVEEQLTVTSQLILKEELRVTRRDTERRDQRTVTLKRESITVVRESASGDSAGGDKERA